MCRNLIVYQHLRFNTTIKKERQQSPVSASGCGSHHFERWELCSRKRREDLLQYVSFVITPMKSCPESSFREMIRRALCVCNCDPDPARKSPVARYYTMGPLRLQLKPRPRTEIRAIHSDAVHGLRLVSFLRESGC